MICCDAAAGMAIEEMAPRLGAAAATGAGVEAACAAEEAAYAGAEWACRCCCCCCCCCWCGSCLEGVVEEACRLSGDDDAVAPPADDCDAPSGPTASSLLSYRWTASR